MDPTLGPRSRSRLDLRHGGVRRDRHGLLDVRQFVWRGLEIGFSKKSDEDSIAGSGGASSPHLLKISHPWNRSLEVDLAVRNAHDVLQDTMSGKDLSFILPSTKTRRPFCRTAG